MLLYTSEYFLEHETGRHPENPERIRTLLAHLDETGLATRCDRKAFGPADLESLTAVHRREYVDAVRRSAAAGGGRIEVDTVVSPQSYDVALHAAGAAVAATDAVIEGDDRRALCLVRPPGHHALANHAMGFCLFNNAAIAARRALDRHGLERVLVVDWDVHHGNGTQALFYDSAAVFYYSIHRWPFYPGTGSVGETGVGAGIGYTLNVPVAFGTPRLEYRDRFDKALEQAAEKCRPQLVLISAGFDSHAQDPIGSLGLETEDFIGLTRAVVEVAESRAAGRLVSLLEGGYNVQALAECVAVHIEELLRAK